MTTGMIATMESPEYLDIVMAIGLSVLILGLILLGILVILGLLYLAYFLLGLPMRRQERARVFLDLIETGLSQGRSAEDTIVSASQSRDQTLGYQFYLLAAHLETGLRLSQGLNQVPRFLPPQVAAILQVGERLGDIRKVLPACRQAVMGASSKLTSAFNYFVVLLLVLNPYGPLLLLFQAKVILPKFQQILGELVAGTEPPMLFLFLNSHWRAVIVIQLTLMLVLLLGALVYVAGPRGIPGFRWLLEPLSNRLAFWLPWRRKRLQRNFSAMLALLLDAGVPEEESVRLAATSTANQIFLHRSEAVIDRLRAGVPLTEAVQALDESGEFRWRLANAAHVHGGFMAALAGWHDALDAKAYQQEQAASQLITTALVVVNGVIVGMICVGVFQALIFMEQGVALW